jgi:hypothetical protein
MTKKLALAAALFALLTAAAPARAAIVQWDLQNVTGNSGQLTATGFFDYDTSNTNLTDWNITVSGTTPLNGAINEVYSHSPVIGNAGPLGNSGSSLPT